MFRWLRRLFRKRRCFYIASCKETGRVLLAIDLDDIVALNVPDQNNPGCGITLRSGMLITCTEWDGEERETNLRYLLDNITD